MDQEKLRSFCEFIAPFVDYKTVPIEKIPIIMKKINQWKLKVGDEHAAKNNQNQAAIRMKILISRWEKTALYKSFFKLKLAKEKIEVVELKKEKVEMDEQYQKDIEYLNEEKEEKLKEVVSHTKIVEEERFSFFFFSPTSV